MEEIWMPMINALYVCGLKICYLLMNQNTWSVTGRASWEKLEETWGFSWGLPLGTWQLHSEND